MKNNKNIKELIFYAILVVILIAISILNNVFWKIGKENKVEENKTTNKQELLEVNNITYNVPYEEMWLD